MVFGFAFPFIFILVFAFMGNGSGIRSYKVAIDNNADTANDLYKSLKNTRGVIIKRYSDKKVFDEDLQHGKIAGINGYIQ